MAGARPHRGRFLVRFEGVDSREEAEALRGTLYVPASEVRELPEDEFWEHDVIGCNVVTVDGTAVGRVVEIVPGPAQDLLEVEGDGKHHLIPFVASIVRQVDPAARVVIVDPPEGLLA